MRFQFDGKTYAVDFQRDFRSRVVYEVRTETKEDGEIVEIPVETQVKSTYPYTTANLFEVDPEKHRKYWPLLRTYTVGCAAGDRFTPEDGRRAALTLMLKDAKKNGPFSKEFKRTLWDTYLASGPIGRRLGKHNFSNHPGVEAK